MYFQQLEAGKDVPEPDEYDEEGQLVQSEDTIAMAELKAMTDADFENLEEW